jgi:hypothetical protein
VRGELDERGLIALVRKGTRLGRPSIGKGRRGRLGEEAVVVGRSSRRLAVGAQLRSCATSFGDATTHGRHSPYFG